VNNRERAKQFMPFDAMKGLTEALKLREEQRTKVSRKQLSEDMIESISRTLSRVRPGSEVRICFYLDGHYVDLESTVADVNKVDNFLMIGKSRIYFEDILRIALV
jgi:hypothetical protein